MDGHQAPCRAMVCFSKQTHHVCGHQYLMLNYWPLSRCLYFSQLCPGKLFYSGDISNKEPSNTFCLRDGLNPPLELKPLCVACPEPCSSTHARALVRSWWCLLSTEDRPKGMVFGNGAGQHQADTCPMSGCHRMPEGSLVRVTTPLWPPVVIVTVVITWQRDQSALAMHLFLHRKMLE